MFVRVRSHFVREIRLVGELFANTGVREQFVFVFVREVVLTNRCSRTLFANVHEHVREHVHEHDHKHIPTQVKWSLELRRSDVICEIFSPVTRTLTLTLTLGASQTVGFLALIGTPCIQVKLHLTR